MNKSLGEVFRSAWKTTTNNFLALFAGIMVYMIPAIVLSLVLWLIPVNEISPGLVVTLDVCLYGYMIFASPLYLGYMTSVLRSWNMLGSPVRMGTAWEAAKANYGKYLKTVLASIVLTIVLVLIIMVIVLIIIAIVLIVTVGPVVASLGFYQNSTDPSALLLGMMMPASIVMFVLVFLYAFCQSFVQFIPGMEGAGGFRAIFKSFRYVFRGNFWKTLGHIVLVTLILLGIEIAVIVTMGLPFLSTLLRPEISTMPIQSLTMWFPVSSLILMAIGILLQTYISSYMFEVYLNAKAADDTKTAQRYEGIYRQ